MGRIIAIGDIHGCFYTLLDLFDKLQLKKEDKIIFLGDYIDRGKHSYKALKCIKALQKDAGEENCICLLGNHEKFMISHNDSYMKSLWKHNGGASTIKDFAKHEVKLDDYTGWLAKLPLVYETETHIFCHAGLTFNEIEKNTEDDILWSRDWINVLEEKNNKRVVFGHTPKGSDVYTTKNGSLCIDTNCVRGGKLTALVLHGEHDVDGEIVSVDKNKKD